MIIMLLYHSRKEGEEENCQLWNIIIMVFSLVAFGSLIYLAHFLGPHMVRRWFQGVIHSFHTSPLHRDGLGGAGLFRNYAGAIWN